MPNVPLTWSVEGSAATITPLGPDSAVVTSVMNGTALVRASVDGGASGEAVAIVAQQPRAISPVDGFIEQGIAGFPLPKPIRVAVRDSLNAAVPGIRVSFSVGWGGGSPTEAEVLSDENGIASVGWTLGQSASTQQVLYARVDGISEPLAFATVARPGPAARISADRGDGQTAEVGAPVAISPRVRVTDQFDNPVPWPEVMFEVTGGNGVIVGPPSRPGTTGFAGIESWRMGPVPGLNTVRASVLDTELSMEFRATGAPILRAAINGPFAQAGPVLTSTRTAPSITVRDVDGNPVAGVPVRFAVTSGGGVSGTTDTSTDANGVASVGFWRLGPDMAPNRLTARVLVPTLENAPLHFEAYGCGGEAESGFGVTLCFTTDLPPAQRRTFERAARRWESLIVGDLPNMSVDIATPCIDPVDLRMNVDDLLIFVSVRNIDGPGKIVGQAGPCRIRSEGGLPVIGLMAFDLADLDQLQSFSLLESVILHEMAHVLGVGTLWDLQSLLVDPSTASTPRNTYFSGPAAIAAFDAVGGVTYTAGPKIPVENTGEAGTINSHWRELVLQNELMTGYLNSGVNPLSLVTIRSLEDLGYRVNPGAADPYTYGSRLRAPGGVEQSIPLHDDILDIPLWQMDEAGREARLR